VSWYKILLPFGNEDSIRHGFKLFQLIQKQHRANGKPHGVALLSKPESSDDGTECWAYYLSPDAAAITLPHVADLTFVPAAKPDTEVPGVSLLYGSLQSSGD